MKNLKTKKLFWSKIIFIALFVFSSTLAPLHTADAWLSIPAALIGNATNWLMKAIEGMITSMIKKAGAMAINKMMSSLVGGGSSGKTLFITNYKDYLRKEPAQKTQSYMNDYLTQMTQGRGSVSGYVPAPSFEGVGTGAFNAGVSAYGNYASRLKDMGAQQVAVSTGAAAVPPVDFTGNPGNMFDSFNMKQFSQYTSEGGKDVPAIRTSAVAVKTMESLEDERDIAMAKAIANAGFVGSEEGGQIIAPGSLVKEKMAGVEDIGNKILAGASGMTEVLGAVITQLVTKSIVQGIGNVQAKVLKEVVSVSGNLNKDLGRQIEIHGPKALYLSKQVNGIAVPALLGL